MIPRPSLLPVFLRELLGPRILPRELEPDLVMADEDQVQAYAEAGRIDGPMAAAYLFHTGRICQVIHGCDRVIDLGCGPATQLAQVAALNPETTFLGIDLSREMLLRAEEHVKVLGLDNVCFAQGDIRSFDQLVDPGADGVISTMTLHHLPELEDLRRCFRAIKRVLGADDALYLVDFGRLKSLNSVIFFAYMNRRHQPHIFSLDYERSLRAAFLSEELRDLAADELPDSVEFRATFGVPFLTLIKSMDRQLSKPLRKRLAAMRQALPRRYRRDLDDLRIFFRLGGLANDPFA